MKLLQYITATLEGAARTLSEPERERALDCFQHYSRECERIGQETEPQSVAYTVHTIIDERVQRMLQTSPHGAEVKCRKGCAHCCQLNVDIFPQEAVLLRMLAAETGIAIDEEKVRRQAAAVAADAWKDLPAEERTCVFLGADHACRVYEHRPAACRKYFVKTNPERCDMVKYPGGQVGIVFDLEAEIIQSAAMTTYGAGNMASMLLRSIEADTTNKAVEPPAASESNDKE